MSILDRLGGSERPKLAVHQFYSALVAFADGKLSRAQIEAGFAVGVDAEEIAELDFLVNTYAAIDSNFSDPQEKALAIAGFQERFLGRLHAIFMLSEHEAFAATWSKAEVAAWLEEAAGVA